MSSDIRDQLSENHRAVMAKVSALRDETDASRCPQMLEDLRQAWLAHVLAEETVVYRALDGPEGDTESSDNANERLVEHELLRCFFDRLVHTPPGTAQWFARLDVVGKLILRHMEQERDRLFPRLAHGFDAEDLSRLSRDFGLAYEKITLLEQAKGH